MNLSAPLPVLKYQAKQLQKSSDVSLTTALNRIAIQEGYSSWSFLLHHYQTYKPRTPVDAFTWLNPGDMLILGARPGLGKTRFAYQLAVTAIAHNHQSFIFTFEYTELKLKEILKELSGEVDGKNSTIHLDCSDEISADYICQQAKRQAFGSGDIIVIDYLQILDQKRSNPDLNNQIKKLKKYAKSTGCIMVFIAQIDRHFDPDQNRLPNKEHLRLPNPVELRDFNKYLFM